MERREGTKRVGKINIFSDFKRMTKERMHSYPAKDYLYRYTNII